MGIRERLDKLEKADSKADISTQVFESEDELREFQRLHPTWRGLGIVLGPGVYDNI